MGDTCIPSVLVIRTAINQLETVTTMKKDCFTLYSDTAYNKVIYKPDIYRNVYNYIRYMPAITMAIFIYCYRR